MGKEEVIKIVEEAIKSFENGTWTFPQLTMAFFVALKYLIEKE